MRPSRLLIVTSLVCAVAIGGCSTDAPTTIDVTGTVIDDVAVISIPDVPTPEPDLEAGTSPSSEDTASLDGVDADRGEQATVGEQMMRQPPAHQQVAETFVTVGQTVAAEAPLVRLDDSLTTAAIAAAEADLAKTRADLGFIEERIGDVEQGRSDAASLTAEAQAALLDLQSQRSDLQLQLDAAKRALESAESSPTTGTPPPGGSPDELRATIAQLEAAIAQVDAAIEEATAAIEELGTAQVDLQTAETVLRGVQAVAAALVEARQIGVSLARVQNDRMTLTAPADALILDVVQPGGVFAVGADAVQLRLAERARIRTWVTADQARLIRDGAGVRVSADSLPDAAYTGLVAQMAPEYRYVPTTFATTDIHLSRGFEVLIDVYGAADLPPGTPVDLSIDSE